MSTFDPGDIAPLLDINRKSQWPEPIGAEAFSGIAGEIVELLAPHTEADRAGLLVTLLVALGNAMGRGPYFEISGLKHGTALFAVLIGTTASGKGMAWAGVRQVMAIADPYWTDHRIVGELSSGEGIAHAVREPTIERREAEDSEIHKADSDGMISTTVDPGVDDKRLFVSAGEFSQVLKVARREGNTLSATVRVLWDDGTAGTLTKHDQTRAKDAQVSIVGHMTPSELKHLNETEQANGFGNRFMWVCVQRSKVLPRGGSLKEAELRPIAERLGEAIREASLIEELSFDDVGGELWDHAYSAELQVEREAPMFAAIVGRAAPITLRLAVLYAALDASHVIRAEHVRAALAVWRYCEASAARLFGGTVGDRLAERILEILHRAGPAGLPKTEIWTELGSRNYKADRIDAALSSLKTQGLADSRHEKTGRPGPNIERWRAVGTNGNNRNGKAAITNSSQAPGVEHGLDQAVDEPDGESIPSVDIAVSEVAGESAEQAMLRVVAESGDRGISQEEIQTRLEDFAEEKLDLAWSNALEEGTLTQCLVEGQFIKVFVPDQAPRIGGQSLG